MNLHDYIVKSEGTWNHPSITSNILALYISGYVPKFNGGCLAILPNDDMFLLLGEDDDHYFDMCNVNKTDLITLQTILKKLSEDVSVKIDFVKCKYKTKFSPNKKQVMTKNYSIKEFKVTITDRGRDTSPFVEIINDKINFSMTFDVSWSEQRYEVISSCLKHFK